MKAKIEKLIARYQEGRLTAAGLYRRICALHMSRHPRVHL